MKQLIIALMVTIMALPTYAAQGVNNFEGQIPFADQAMPVRFHRIQSMMYRQTAGIQFENSGEPSFGEKSLSPFNASASPEPYLINFFSYPVTAFSLDFGDKDPDADTLIIRAYSDYQGRGELLAEVTAHLPETRGFNQKRLAVEAAGIRSVVFIGGSSEAPNSVYYDNFRAASRPARTSFNEEVFSYSDFAVYRPGAGALYTVRFAGAPVYKHFSLGAGKAITGDYDGDNLSDAAIFNNGAWNIQQSAAGNAFLNFGSLGDIPVSADFDNDGKTDIAVFRPEGGFWYVLRSSDGAFMAAQFGQSDDVPVPANYDSDGRADFAVFRGGAWYILGSKDGFWGVRFGVSSDKPVPADYDADGITDIAVFRDGIWYQLLSKGGFRAEAFGQAGDIPVPNDYFTDIPLNYSTGKDDIAVFRPENGTWYVRTATGFSARQWGQAGDIPISLAP